MSHSVVIMRNLRDLWVLGKYDAPLTILPDAKQKHAPARRV